MNKRPHINRSVSIVCLLSLTIIELNIQTAASAKTFSETIPDTAQVYRLKAIESCEQSNPELALELYQKAIEVAASSFGADSSYLSDLYFEMGAIAKQFGKLKKAEHCFVESLQYGSNSVNARLQLASIYREQGKERENFKQIQDARAKDPKSPLAAEALVLYIQGRKRPAEAAHIALLMQNMSDISSPTSSKGLGPRESNTMSTSTRLPYPKVPDSQSPESLSRTESRLMLEAAPKVNESTSSSPGILKKIFGEANKKSQLDSDAKVKAEKEKEVLLEKEIARLRLEKDEANRRAKSQPKGKGSTTSNRNSKAQPKSVRIKSTRSSLESLPALKTRAEALPKGTSKVDEQKGPNQSGEASASAPQIKDSTRPGKLSKPAGFSQVGATKGGVEPDRPAEPSSDSATRNKASEDLRKAPPIQVATPIRVMLPKPNKGSRSPKSKSVLVPPPPPATPIFPGNFMPAVPLPPPMNPQPTSKVKTKPKERTKDYSAEETSATSNTGIKDDSEFLIDWGGANQKKKVKQSK